jgi:uncharacterized membrane protein
MFEAIIKLLIIIAVVIVINIFAFGLRALFGGAVAMITLLLILIAACIVFVKQDMKQNSNN